jgi:hypothetical protein
MSIFLRRRIMGDIMRPVGYLNLNFLLKKMEKVFRYLMKVVLPL